MLASVLLLTSSENYFPSLILIHSFTTQRPLTNVYTSSAETPEVRGGGRRRQLLQAQKASQRTAGTLPGRHQRHEQR